MREVVDGSDIEQESYESVLTAHLITRQKVDQAPNDIALGVFPIQSVYHDGITKSQCEKALQAGFVPIDRTEGFLSAHEQPLVIFASPLLFTPLSKRSGCCLCVSRRLERHPARR